MKIPDYIERKRYINRVMPYVRKDIIKILVGQRRVGKSYLLFQLMDRISKLDPAGLQIYINKELHKFSGIRNADDLMSYIESRRSRDRRLYLFIDELQVLTGLRRLCAVSRQKEM